MAHGQLPDFRLVQGGRDGACRGACPSDVDESYYELRVAVATLSACQQLCRDDVRCTGVEYNENGRCELWQRGEGVGSTTPKEGYNCYHNNFQPIDGGADRACRGDHPLDSNSSHYHLSGPRSLAECKEHCMQTPGCTGIEHKTSGRCEIWTGSIRATAAREGYNCLRYVPQDPPVTRETCSSRYEACGACEREHAGSHSDPDACWEAGKACTNAVCAAQYDSCSEQCTCDCEEIPDDPEYDRGECCYHQTAECFYSCDLGYSWCMRSPAL